MRGAALALAALLLMGARCGPDPDAGRILYATEAGRLAIEFQGTLFSLGVDMPPGGCLWVNGYVAAGARLCAVRDCDQGWLWQDGQPACCSGLARELRPDEEVPECL